MLFRSVLEMDAVLLDGEPGVGKTAIVEGLAEKIAIGDVPQNLKEKRIISIDISGMVAGTKYRGDFEERIKKALGEVCGLTWEDIDFKNRIINVKYTVYDKPRDEKGRWYIETTENFYISSTKENKKNVSDIFDKEMNSDIIQDIVKYEIG